MIIIQEKYACYSIILPCVFSTRDNHIYRITTTTLLNSRRKKRINVKHLVIADIDKPKSELKYGQTLKTNDAILSKHKHLVRVCAARARFKRLSTKMNESRQP